MCLRVEIEGTAEPEGADTHVDDGRAVVSVLFVEGEMTAGLHAFEVVGVAWLRIWHLVDELLDVRDGAFESLVDLAERSFDVRNLAAALESFDRMVRTSFLCLLIASDIFSIVSLSPEA